MRGRSWGSLVGTQFASPGGMKNESPSPDAAHPDRAEPSEKHDGAPEFPLSKLLTGPAPEEETDKGGKVPSHR